MSFGINMDYCKFENTAKAINQCIESMRNGDDEFEEMSSYEQAGYKEFLNLFQDEFIRKMCEERLFDINIKES